MSGSGSYRKNRDGTLQHQRRVKDRSGSLRALAACPACGKLMYATRRDAKAAARQHDARDGRMRAYLCGDFWHLTSDTAAAWYRERDA